VNAPILLITASVQGLGRPSPTLVPCWQGFRLQQGTSVGAGLPQPSVQWQWRGSSLIGGACLVFNYHVMGGGMECMDLCRL
jgi:hypothetical protein